MKLILFVSLLFTALIIDGQTSYFVDDISGNEDKSRRVKSNFDGLYTEGCYIHHVDRTGWSNTSVWWNRSLKSKWGEMLADRELHNWYPSQKVIFRNNKFERSGAN